MIKKLRWKFIRITMSSVFAVLLLIVISVNSVNIYQNNRSADTVTEMLLMNNGSFRKNMMDFDKDTMTPPEEQNDFKDRFHNKEELPFTTRFFTITVDNAENIIAADLSNIASVTEEEVEIFARDILAKNHSVGWYKTYRYRVGESDAGTLVIVMESTGTRNSISSVLAITSIVGVAAFLVVFLLVTLLSERAIQPISETYEKQKQFVTDAGHELKTPLTVIAANAEVIGMTYGENDWTKGIVRQTDNMRTLIEKMIRMSKLDEGGQTLCFEPFNISDAVYDTAMTFSSVAASKGLKLTADVPPDLIFRGDEAAIRQVVSILTDNAVKYCDRGGEVHIALSKSSRGFGKEKVYIGVRNTFSAVSGLDTSKLFDRFYRGDTAHTCAGSYGLGLSIAKTITELHGGRIDVRNLSGKDIEFSVTLL